VDGQVQLAALLTLADMPATPEAGAAIWKSLATSKVADDRWLPDAAISAAAKNDVHFLTAAAAAKSELSSAQTRALEIVSEHYARGVPQDSIQTVLQKIAGAHPSVTGAILKGMAVGWPKNTTLKLNAATEDVLVSLLKTAPAASRSYVVTLANRLGSTGLEKYSAEVAASFLAQLRDEAANGKDRVAAATSYVEFRRQDADTARELLTVVSPRTESGLALSIVDALERSESAATGAAIVERIKSFTPGVRNAAIRVLVSRTDWSGNLLDSLEKGDVQLTDLTLDQKQALASHPNKPLAQRAKALLAKGGGLPNPDRQRVLDELMPLTKVSADANAGHEVFKKQCQKCHTHSGEGNKIGPDLTGMAVHPKLELLTHIIDPSRSVEGNFRVYTVVTDDGRVLNGLLASESKTAVELIDSEAKRHAIQRSDIEQMVASPKSLMPEGFEKQVSKDDIANLLEFLTRRGKYLPLSLDKVATIVTTKGMFNTEDATVERLIFPDWSPKTFEGVPFTLVDPQGNRRPNAIMLYGKSGKIGPTMPKGVMLPCNSPLKAVHLLSGVSGWGYPASPKGTVSLIVRFHYGDGKTEDHPLINGEHFADYIRRVEVPGSKLAFELRGQQIRYLAVSPNRPDEVKEIELLKGPDVTVPVVMAVTLEFSQAGKH
jgi:putative heme-binding domain-containing protein